MPSSRASGTRSADAALRPYASGVDALASTSIDVNLRVWEHNNDDDRAASHTRMRRPVALVWCAFDESTEPVFQWEKRIQGWFRAKKEALIEGRLADLPGLSRSQARVQDGE